MLLISSKLQQNLIYLLLIILASIFLILVAACTSEPITTLTEAAPLPSISSAPSPTAPTSALPDVQSLVYSKTIYPRSDHCKIAFKLYTTQMGNLELGIAENLYTSTDPGELATQLSSLYQITLEAYPSLWQTSASIYILPDADEMDCYSWRDEVFTTPELLNSLGFAADLLGAGGGISEPWVRFGLASLAFEGQPDREEVKGWLENSEYWGITSLYAAWFEKTWASPQEIDIAVQLASSLVDYAINSEGIPPLNLTQTADDGLRNRWLVWLGLDLDSIEHSADRLHDFEYSSSAECGQIVQTDTIHFCLNRQPNNSYFDEVQEAEYLVEHAYYGRQALADYVSENAPSISHILDSDEVISITTLELERLGFTDINSIFLSHSAIRYDDLHEIVHTFDWNHLLVQKNIMLAEGFAEYLGKLLPLYDQNVNEVIYYDLQGKVLGPEAGDYAAYSSWYFLDPEQMQAAQAWYANNGGQKINIESINARLFTDAVAFATLERPTLGMRGMPIGMKYRALYPNYRFEDQYGFELSYTQAASFVGWLCDTYTLDRVLNVYVNNAEKGLLDGKAYETLKLEWRSALLDKGQGIPVPPAQP